MVPRLLLPILLVASALACPALAAGPHGYYRYPALHGNRLVFTAEGDLWTVGLKGGPARRLTTHLGQETHAAISPDGTQLAFTAEYEGPHEAYVMPLAGGRPRRLTFEGASARVVGWAPMGRVLYATRHFSTLPNTQLVTIDPHDGRHEVVPLAQAADGTWDDAGKTLFFTRQPPQYSSTKRYRGGTAQQIWKYTAGANEAQPLTTAKQYAGTSKRPLWWRGRLYFVTDRDGTMDLWSMNPSGKNLKQHTFHEGFDVQSPSLSEGKIAYQLGADVRVFDIAEQKDTVVPITLPSDFEQTREQWIDKPQEYLTSTSLSADGQRVALTSRGNVFVAPVGPGRLVRVTRRPGVRYREARFLPGGEGLLALSDQTGEFEFWRLAADGIGVPEQLTSNGKVLRFAPVPAPGGEAFAYYDKNQQLWIYDLKQKKHTRVAVSDNENFAQLAWSPDGRHLAFAQLAANSFRQVMIYSLDDAKVRPLTSDRVDSYSPSWSPDGKWLYFLSDRRLVTTVPSPWGARQPEPYFENTTKIYEFALQPGERSRFLPPNELVDDEAKGGEDDKPKEATAEAKEQPGKGEKNRKKQEKPDAQQKGAAADDETAEDEGRPQVKIDWQDHQRRITEAPLAPGNYSSLTVNGTTLFWLARKGGSSRNGELQAAAIKNQDVKLVTVAEGVRDYELSGDGKKLLVRKGDDLYVVAAAAKPANLAEAKVDLSDWSFSINPRDEWRQMFVDAWRMERDYFYDPNLHGIDWQGLLDRHLPLVDRVTDREELNDLLRQIVGELEALHIGVRGGDRREGEDQVGPASLGAVLVRDAAAGGYRVEHIYRADPDYPDELAPLARLQVNVAEGEVIQSINGVSTLSRPPGELLRNQAGRQVRLRVQGKAAQPRDVIVEPVSMQEEASLRYTDWEYSRRQEVERRGKGRIGYLHLRAMSGRNYTEWARNFYPVFDRQGLIIDVRNNSGGNIDSWILEKLLRRAWFYWQPRVGQPYWNMQYAFRGHLVVICNEWTASDGEAFTEGFRRLGLGKVIGTRTWGGEIWLSYNNPLVDKGMASAAQYGVYGPEGKWLIEGHGVEPDIVVDNLPHATFEGKDAQLQRAIKHLQKLIREDPRPVPPAPPYPDKVKERAEVEK